MKKQPVYLFLALFAATSFADAPKQETAKAADVKAAAKPADAKSDGKPAAKPVDKKADAAVAKPGDKKADAQPAAKPVEKKADAEPAAKPADAKVVAEPAQPAKIEEPVAKAAELAPADTTYDPKKYIGVAVTDATGKLQFVAENASQTHSKENFVMVRVKGIKVRSGDKEKGRVRIAVWDAPTNYAKEGTKPFRASSHWAKDSQNGEMIFKIGGLEKGKTYSFFAHFDKENRGFVKKVLGIPVDPFLFTNVKNQGTGKGLTREGLKPPKFENTLVTYNNPGQEIVMEF